MIIFPAVDIKDGKAVRLLQGKAEDKTVYGEPYEMALKWQEMGAQYLHMVDLDGAFDGVSKNLEIIEKIAKELTIPIQLGGGIRTIEDVDRRMDAGISRVILGTVAINNFSLVQMAAAKYPKQIAVGIDAKDGKVAIKGWVEDSGIDAYTLAVRVRDVGVDTIIYTDIAKDGMLVGPNFEATQKMMQSGLQVVASGGVGSVAHLETLSEMQLYGAIVGKALYDGAVDLKDALAI